MKNEILDKIMEDKKFKPTRDFLANLVRVFNLLSKSQIADLKSNGKKYSYPANGKTYIVIDANTIKVAIGEDFNYVFDKIEGKSSTWGENYKSDPKYSPIGPQILDLEISVNGCPNNCHFCSPKGTAINTPDGFKNIEKIKKGDLVIGFDVKEVRPVIQSVQETYKRHYGGDLICIELDNGDILKLTPEHIVILKDGIEKMAKDVSESDQIISF